MGGRGRLQTSNFKFEIGELRSLAALVVFLADDVAEGFVEVLGKFGGKLAAFGEFGGEHFA
jgi:hypothetical protein